MNQEIINIIKPMLGLKCEHAGRSFGTMLLIDFGKYTPYVSKISSKQMDDWEWGLNVQDARWYLEQDGTEIISNAFSEEEISEKIKVIEGKVLEDIEISDDLDSSMFIFSDGVVLAVFPKPNKSEQWTLKTPGEKYLTMYSDLTWDYVPGNTPVRK